MTKRPTRYRRVRTPTVLQMEATECGAASLGIILAYHGRYVPLEELRAECRVSRDGSNALYIKKAAERYGLEQRGRQRTVEQLRTLRPPFMVFWELNHFLVVEGFGPGKVHLSDPATGRRTVDERTFRQAYTGIVFEFEPGPRFRKGGVRPNTWRSIQKRMKGAMRAIAHIVLAGLAVMVCELVAAAYNLVFVDQVLIEERSAWIRPLVLFMGLTALFRVAAAALQLGSLRRLELGLAMTHSSRFLWHVLRLPITFYQQRYAGDVSGRVDGNSQVAELISGQLATTIVGMLLVCFYALVMFAFDPLLAGVGMLIGALNLAGISFASQFLRDENLKIKQVRACLYGGMMRAVQVIETIKSGALESETLVRLSGYQARITNSFQLVGTAGALLVVMPPLLLVATTATVLWIGGHRVIEGVLGIGSLVALQTLMTSFNRPFGDLVRLGSGVQSLQAELARLDDVIDYPVDPVFSAASASGPVLASGAAPRRLSGRLELRGVTFGYSRTVDEPLVRHLDLEIQPGSRVAIVGASGSGKSTIGRLVAGLYRPWEGQVLYDGHPIDEIPREVFTDQVALVDDQTFLFAGTARENLTLWDETVLDRDVTRAAIDAAIHHDLIRRRGGYHARLAEGARNVSGGQRQRLEIARALLRNPALLVLDEATNALDPITEALVDDNLRRRGCTCLIIAHRLSTVRDCDQILVLRQGRVVQRGTHDELMADRDGFYHELQTIQDALDAPLATETADSGGTNGNETVIDLGGSGHVSTATNGPGGHTPANGRTDPGEDPSPAAAPSTAATAAARARTWGLGSLMHQLEPFGQTVSTSGNRPLPLDDAGAVWRVVSGKVDVFYVEPPEPGLYVGRRRHLCRVDEAGSIFAIEGVRSEEQGGLLAVGVGQALLRKFPRADLLRLSLEPDWRRDVAEMIDDWVDRISRAADPGITPRSAVWLEPDTTQAVEAGQCVSTRSRVLWIRHPDEGLRFFGTVDVPACPYGARFPLSEHAWVRVDTAREFQPWDTQTLMENGDPWIGLKRFHRVILDAIAQARVYEAAYREARLEMACQRDRGAVMQALGGLERLARPDAPAAFGHTDDDLLEVCREVGAACGIEVKAPPLESGDDALRLIALASDFSVRRVRLDDDWWTTDAGPLLAYVQTSGRPVALLGQARGGYQMVDPMRGQRVVVTPELAATLAPTAVMFYRGLTSDHQDGRGLLRFALPVVGRELRAILALGVVTALLGLVVPVVMGLVIDDAIPHAEAFSLAVLCVFMIGVGLTIALFQTVQGLALVRIKGRLESTVLPAVWDRLLGLPARFFAAQEAGELALRAMGLARVIEVLASTSVASLLVGLFGLSSVVMLFVYNWRLAIAAVVLLAVPPAAVAVALPSLWRCQRAIARAQGRISSYLLVLLGGIARVRGAGAERRAFARWAGKYRQQLELMLRFQSISDRLIMLGEIWPMVVLMVVFAGTVALGPKAMSNGDFLAFNLALTQATAAIIGLGRGVLPLLNGLEQFERFRPVLEASPEVVETQAGSLTLGGALRVSGVSFRYQPDGPLVLDNVGLQVRPGEFVAVVGPSGSGKSTLLRLLLGFETPDEGLIAYDGRELSTLDVREVRRQIGVVLQDAHLLPGDIYSNIIGFSPVLTRADAMAAAELAGLADDIEAMPMGIHTVLGEGGGGLSSGQRQRLIIARALARRPRILLLDEATSALDNRSQAFVSQSIHTRLRGTSRLVIAHRLSTIIEADRIYVMVEGRVVQTGRYSQLVREPGPFRDLARRQSLT